MKRLGVLGGTFDPIHYGHLRLAEEALEKFQLDKVLFIPVRVSPFKQGEWASSPEDRLKMVELAIAGNPAFESSTMEIEREGPSYTVDTLKALRAHYPHTELFLLTGTDAAVQLPEWRDPEKILKLASVVASARPGMTLRQLKRRLPENYHERIKTLDMLPIDISATSLRRRIAAGCSMRYLTPDPVVEYIREKGLYQ